MMIKSVAPLQYNMCSVYLNLILNMSAYNATWINELKSKLGYCFYQILPIYDENTNKSKKYGKMTTRFLKLTHHLSISREIYRFKKKLVAENKWFLSIKFERYHSIKKKILNVMITEESINRINILFSDQIGI